MPAVDPLSDAEDVSRKDRRETQQLGYAVAYAAEFLAISDGCLGWDPIMDVVCGDGTNTIAELIDGGIRLGDASSPEVSCSEHPEFGRSAIRCRIPSIDPAVPVDNFDPPAFFLMGFICYGPTLQSVVGRSNFLPASLVCDANHVGIHSTYIRVSREQGLEEDFACEPEEAFGNDGAGISNCLAITDCTGQSCSIPMISAIQQSPIPADAVFSFGTSTPTQSPTTVTELQTFWEIMFAFLRQILPLLEDLL